MATAKKTLAQLGDVAHTVTWDLKFGDDGQPVEFIGSPAKCVQVSGAFGDVGNGMVVIEGSNDGKHWDALQDAAGNDVVTYSARLLQVCGIAAQIRPRVIGGDAKTALTVTMLFRKGQ